MKILKTWFRQPLYLQIFIGIVLGIVLGLLFSNGAKAVKPIGDIFLKLLMMLIVPLTFFTLVSGVTKMENLRSLRSLGGRTVILYLASSLLAASLGLLAALLIQPGRSASGLLATDVPVQPQSFNVIDNLVNWIPSNPLAAMVEGNMLQIIFFSLIIGIALLAMGERAERLSKLVADGADLMITVTNGVMKFAPFGICALIANLVASFDATILAEVGRFVLADYLACALLFLVVFPLLMRLLGRIKPWLFYRQSASAILVAASTTSSAATLPASMKVASENLSIPEKIWGFTLPLGATINMDGMAAGLGVISVFAAHLHQLPLTPMLLAQFIFLGLILSVGTAGVKGGGIVISSVLLQTLNLPLTLVPILAAVWPILDIAHTSCNVSADLSITAIIAAREDRIDPDIISAGKVKSKV